MINKPANIANSFDVVSVADKAKVT